VGARLGENRYGKAETRLLRVTRAGDRHEIRDLSVSVALSGDFEAAFLRGDNSAVLPTDSQKNAVYALAAGAPVGEIEELALRLGRHFVTAFAPVRRALVDVDERPWARISVGDAPHPHAFREDGPERRLASVTCEAGGDSVVSGLTGLALLKSAGSEFHGFLRDRYTTLEETRDRILATAVTARWRHAGTGVDWAESFAGARRALIEAFAAQHSLSLQQTLYEMGRAVLAARPEIVEVRLTLPNRHHFPVDLRPFGLESAGEVFFPADRPYGLIEGTVLRDDVPPP
jgi:urate oxidase